MTTPPSPSPASPAGTIEDVRKMEEARNAAVQASINLKADLADQRRKHAETQGDLRAALTAERGTVEALAADLGRADSRRLELRGWLAEVEGSRRDLARLVKPGTSAWLSFVDQADLAAAVASFMDGQENGTVTRG